MAISYPLALPDVNHFRRVTMKAESRVGASESPFTAQTQIQAFQGMRWHSSIDLTPMKRVKAAAWVAFLVSLNGKEGTFLLFDPAAPTPQGTVPGTGAVDGASQTGRTLATNGWTPSQTGILLAGDYIQVGTGATTRMYKVLQDVNSDGAGEATLDIWPRLRESPTDTETLITTRAKGTFRLADNMTEWDVNVAQFYGLGFEAVEAY